MRTSRSILAGCTFSVALTRVYLKCRIVSLVNEYPEANAELLVDGTPMHSAGTEQRIYENLIPATLRFEEVVDALELKLSPKATIAASKQHMIDRLIGIRA